MFSLIKKVLAKTDIPGDNTSSTGFKFQLPGGLPPDVCALLDKVTDFLISVSIPIAGLMILWSAYQILTAGGNPEQFNKGKRTIMYTLIGLGVVILSKGVVTIVTDLLSTGNIDSFCKP